MQTFTSVPFKTETHHGLSSVNGIAKFSGAGVILEFESKLFGMIGGGVKEVRLAKADILDLRFKKGFYKRFTKIVIRTTTVAKLAELPASEGKLILNIARDDFERARDAVAQLLSDMASQSTSLPPTHTPVSVLFDESEDETRRL